MTREEVSQIYYLNQEIEELQRKLKELRGSGLQSPKIDGMPKAPGRKSSPTEKKGVAEADLELQIESLLHEVKRKQREIIEYIRYAKEKGCQMTGTEDINIERLNVLDM